MLPLSLKFFFIERQKKGKNYLEPINYIGNFEEVVFQGFLTQCPLVVAQW